MAAFNTINVQQQTRPCWVEGRRAIFHRWTDSARPAKARGMEGDENAQRYQLHSVHALVEYEDGTVSRVWPTSVQFADSDHLFTEYDWDAMEAQRDALPYTFDEVAEKKPAKETLHALCGTCAHVNDNEEFCPANEYDCQECTVIGCYCKTCRDYKKWEPKGGTAL